MIFDRGQVGREATGASAGMIMAVHGRSTPVPLVALASESARLFAALAEELKLRTGMDIGYRRAGRGPGASDETAAAPRRLASGARGGPGGHVRWGRHLVALRTLGTALRNVIDAGDGYALTKPDGSTIVGTTVEDAGFDARPTASGVEGLLKLAPQLAPRLADATFSGAWAGLRPGT